MGQETHLLGRGWSLWVNARHYEQVVTVGLSLLIDHLLSGTFASQYSSGMISNCTLYCAHFQLWCLPSESVEVVNVFVRVVLKPNRLDVPTVTVQLVAAG